MKSNKIIWEQPDKYKEIYFGVVEGRVFFSIERKGKHLCCSSTHSALMGIYSDWDKDLNRLKTKALRALQNKGIVNHVLN